MWIWGTPFHRSPPRSCDVSGARFGGRFGRLFLDTICTTPCNLQCFLTILDRGCHKTSFFFFYEGLSPLRGGGSTYSCLRRSGPTPGGRGREGGFFFLKKYPIADADSATVPTVSSMLASCFCLLCVVCWSLCVVVGLVARWQSIFDLDGPKVQYCHQLLVWMALKCSTVVDFWFGWP